MGYMDFMLSNYLDAIYEYNVAIKLNPTNYLAYNNRGNANLRIGNFIAAISDYDTAFELNPKYFVAYTNLVYAKKRLMEIQNVQQK